MHLAEYCPLLEVLNFNGAAVRSYDMYHRRSSFDQIFNTFVSILQSITDDSIQKLAQNCPNIHYLCVSGCANLTDTSLMALAQHCHKLSTFEAAGCSQFTDGGFQALARVWRPTLYFFAYCVHLILCCFVSKNCHYLEKMDLEDCVLISDNTLTHLAAGCPRLEQLVNTKKIQLTISFYNMRVELIFDH